MQFSGQPGPGRFYKPKGLKQNHFIQRSVEALAASDRYRSAPKCRESSRLVRAFAFVFAGAVHGDARLRK